MPRFSAQTHGGRASAEGEPDLLGGREARACRVLQGGKEQEGGEHHGLFQGSGGQEAEILKHLFSHKQ